VANREHWFSKIATQTANNSGRPWAFGVAGLFVAGVVADRAAFLFLRYLAVGDEYHQQYRDILDGVSNSKCTKQRQLGSSGEAG
jgi:hypothetical protein